MRQADVHVRRTEWGLIVHKQRLRRGTPLQLFNLALLAPVRRHIKGARPQAPAGGARRILSRPVLLAILPDKPPIHRMSHRCTGQML